MSVYGFLATCVILCDVKVAQVTCSLAGHSPTRVVVPTQKSDNLVEVIKKDLKRNNDDYKEPTIGSNLVAGTSTVQVAIKSVPVSFYNKRIKIKSNININRRINDHPSYEMYDFLVQSPITESRSTGSIVTKTPLRLRKLSPGLNFLPSINNQSIVQKINEVMTPSLKPFLMKQKHQQKTSPQHTSKNNIDKFKQFMQQNREMFKQYISGKTVVESQKLNLRQNFPKQNEQRNGLNIDQTNSNRGKLSNTELLDMAPARGGRIFRHRLKGRLCHRHVLMPEGPKYDSAGQQYLRAHGAGPPRGRRRDYARTRPPALLLPRCCNCCKKSALGCQ